MARAGLWVRLRGVLADRGEASLARRLAGTAFLIRALGAALAFVSQVLLARWMGQSEYGIYVYAWTWMLVIGGICALGSGTTAQRFIPEYREHRHFDLLRGFLVASRATIVAIASLVAIAGATGLWLFSGSLDHFTLLPLYFACVALPLHALSETQSGISRSYDWVNLALLPSFVLRQLLLIAVMGLAFVLALPTDAVTAMAVTFGALVVVVSGQFIILNRRLDKVVPAAPHAYAPRRWFGVAMPIFMVECFYLLLTYTDVLVLQQFRPPEEVASYFAATRVLAPVAFVYFAVAQTAAHKFSEYAVIGDRARLASHLRQSVRMTFWPSVLVAGILLLLGRPLMSLFGAGFADAYYLLFLLVIGMLARATVGPIERLLNMLDQQRACALVYAGAFAFNLVGCLVLIPHFGATGAAISISAALVLESLALFLLTRSRLGLHGLIFGSGKTE